MKLLKYDWFRNAGKKLTWGNLTISIFKIDAGHLPSTGCHCPKVENTLEQVILTQGALDFFGPLMKKR